MVFFFVYLILLINRLEQLKLYFFLLFSDIFIILESSVINFKNLKAYKIVKKNLSLILNLNLLKSK